MLLLLLGYLNEGWVDPRKYLLAVRSKSNYLGTDFVKGRFGLFKKKERLEIGDYNIDKK